MKGDPEKIGRLRDEFAMCALQGIVAHAGGEYSAADPEKTVRNAYKLADAMLKARIEKKGEE